MLIKVFLRNNSKWKKTILFHQKSGSTKKKLKIFWIQKRVNHIYDSFYLDFLRFDEISISTVNVTVLDQTKMLIQVAVRSKRGWGLGPDLRHLRHVLIHWLGRHERSIGETIGESFVVNFTGPVSCQNKQS